MEGTGSLYRLSVINNWCIQWAQKSLAVFPASFQNTSLKFRADSYKRFPKKNSNIHVDRNRQNMIYMLDDMIWYIWRQCPSFESCHCKYPTKRTFFYTLWTRSCYERFSLIFSGLTRNCSLEPSLSLHISKNRHVFWIPWTKTELSWIKGHPMP